MNIHVSSGPVVVPYPTLYGHHRDATCLPGAPAGHCKCPSPWGFESLHRQVVPHWVPKMQMKEWAKPVTDGKEGRVRLGHSAC